MVFYIVPCMSCLFFFFFLRIIFYVLGCSLNEQLPSLLALSLHRTPTISSCEEAQLCLSLPKKHISKCKAVAAPETAGLLSHCSVVRNSHEDSVPKKYKNVQEKTRKTTLKEVQWKCLQGKGNCCTTPLRPA